MKYAKFSDDFLSDFRLDDNGETLVLTDERGYSRAVKLLPYEERPQGEWIDDDYTVGYTCSVCGSYRTDAKVSNFKFCPDCGADMRGGVEMYREETCENKSHCYDYEHWHCIGCNGCKKGGAE